MKIELKDVVNVVFTNFARGFARVEIDGKIKQIRFTTTKDSNGKIKFEVYKGMEYCIVALDGYY